MKKYSYVILSILIWCSCATVKKLDGKFISNQGDEIGFKNDSIYNYFQRTDAGMTAFSHGKYSIDHNKVYMQNDFNTALKTFYITLKPSTLTNGPSTLSINSITADKDLTFDISINDQKWRNINQPVSLVEKAKSIRLKAYLNHGILYGTVPLVDTLYSQTIALNDGNHNYEINSNIDSRDFYRIMGNDTLKILNKGKLKSQTNKKKIYLIYSNGMR